MGNATTTKPHQGFDDPKLAQIFATQAFLNHSIVVTTYNIANE